MIPAKLQSQKAAISDICEKFKRNNQKDPLVQDDTPQYPFQKISFDLFEYALIDAYSNFAKQVKNKTFEYLIQTLSEIFYQLGCESHAFEKFALTLVFRVQDTLKPMAWQKRELRLPKIFLNVAMKQTK